MSRRFFSPLLIACALAGIGSSAFADTYNVVNDFSQNPQPENGVWTYLANGSPLTVTATVPNGSGSLYYWTNGESVPNSASVSRNTGSTAPIGGNVVIPHDHLNLDPESLPNVSVEFTAPSTGIYTISGNFIGDDTDSTGGGVVPIHPVSVLDNSTPIFSGLITQFGAGDNDTFNLTETLNAGDTIAFVVGTSMSSFSNLGTGLEATISNSTPEPGSVALLCGLGLSGAALLPRRRKTKRPSH